MNKISLKFFAIVVFSLLSFLAVSIVLYIDYNFNQKIIKQTVNSQFNELALNFTKNLQNIEKSYRNSVDIFTIFLQDVSMDYIYKNDKKMVVKFTDFLKIQKNISTMYVTNSENISFSVKRANFKSVKESGFKYTWMKRSITKNQEIRTFYDENLLELKTITLKNSINYTNRTWYKKALQNPKLTIRTEPYEFDLNEKLGLTYAKEYKKGYVFGLDFPLKNANEIIRKSASGDVVNAYVIAGEDDIIISPSEKYIKIIKKIYNNRKNIDSKHIIKINGTQYICTVNPIGDDFLVSYSNFDTLMYPYKDELKKNIFITICIILVLSLIVWYFTSRMIIEPIYSLVVDSRKIASRDFDGIVRINSNIEELSMLSNSMVRMSEEVQDYQIRLEQISTTDALTGVFNRSMIDKVIKNSIEEFIRYGHIFGIMIVDIDHFKHVNDDYGHQMGDKILVEFAMLLKKNIRSVDLLGRWGGEEFIVICKETSMENLYTLAQKIKKIIQSHEFETAQRMTASFGITICYEGDNIDRLIRRADAALYEAKNSGRNKVVTG